MVGPGPAHAVQYLTIEQAQRLCFAEATTFEPADVKLTREQMRAIEKDSRVDVREATEKVWRVLKGTTFLGWFIEDQVVGKHEFITWALALNADGSVRQIEILDYRETYGHEIRNPKWREQFVGKTRGAPLKLDKDIKNNSGATLSHRHLTRRGPRPPALWWGAGEFRPAAGGPARTPRLRWRGRRRTGGRSAAPGCGRRPPQRAF